MMFVFILFLNVIWFGLGFYFFVLCNKIFVKILVLKEYWEIFVFDMLVEIGKFLGGFNFVFCVFNFLILIMLSIFLEDS